MGFFSPRRMAVAAAVVVIAGTYSVGHLVGRSGDRVASPATPAPATASPAIASPALATPASPSPGTVPAGDEPADRQAGQVTLPQPGDTLQPITGPGNPPLPHTGTGPYGTRRTTGAGYAALTFDDGPDPQWTPEVLALLREYDVRATFCVVGQLVEAYPDLLREIAADGHTLCNHSWDHDVGLGSRSRDEIRDDLQRTDAAIRTAVPAARISYYRQPGGAWTQRVVDVAEEMGMSALHWDVDPQDWQQRGAGAIASEVTTATVEGSIVLLHDGGGQRQDTVSALRTILPELAGRLQLDGLPSGVDPPRRHGIELPARLGQR